MARQCHVIIGRGNYQRDVVLHRAVLICHGEGFIDQSHGSIASLRTIPGHSCDGLAAVRLTRESQMRPVHQTKVRRVAENARHGRWRGDFDFHGRAECRDRIGERFVTDVACESLAVQ